MYTSRASLNGVCVCVCFVAVCVCVSVSVFHCAEPY